MSVERIVNDGIREADALEKALEDERRALESRDAAALGAAAEEKRRRVARLEALEAARIAATPQIPAAAERPAAGIDREVAARADQWQQFLAIVARCNALNTTNGAIIRLRRQQVGDALRVVSGTGAGTYGPSGSQSASRPRKALAAV
jgi:flagellar biosynthesis/type III secretory pathway chaperone